ncbi:hypothetical protein BIW16_11575 [Vibrio sp. OULL4]|nr:glycosyltransferase [Vibrio parahaemolyticus]OOI02276.1 hypothetical protein BIW16_11575 [Vibrio sp. OULL4]
MKKFLIVNKQFFPDIGGVETVVAKYANFASDNNEVTILCCSRDLSLKTKIEKYDKINIIRCSSFGTFKSMPISISFIYYFFKEINKHEVINFHYPFPMIDFFYFFYPYKNRKRIFVTWHSDIIKQKWLKRFFKPFTRSLINNATVIATSLPLKESSDFLKNKDDVTILPLSCERYESYKEIKKDYFGRDLPNEFVLFQGRLAYYKGLDVLLNAYLNLKEQGYSSENIPKLIISGDGDLKEFMLNYIADNNLENYIYPLCRFVSNDEKAWLFKKCKFFIFPSTHPSEAFGLVQLEAMSEGKPVINTMLPTGVPWVSVDKETGLTVRPSCSRQLSEAIFELSSNKENLNVLGQNAKQRFDGNFDDRLIKHKFNKIIG